MKKILINQRETSLAPFLKSGWSYLSDRDALTKTFIFVNSIESEKLNHHPEWSNVYKTVEVTLTTHDVGGLSDLDLTLASKLDSLA